MAIDKEVNLNLTATDKATPKVVKLSRTLEKKLVRANERTSDSFTKVQMTAKAAAAGMATTQTASKNLEKQNNALIKSMESIDQSQKIQKMTNAMTIMVKVARVASAAFIVFVGKDRAFDIINQAAIRLSNTVERMANFIKRLGGPFARLAPILFLLRDGLRSNTAALAAFSVVGSGTIKNALDLKDSLLKNISTQLTFAEKVQLGSLALKNYGKVLVQTDGFLNKIKGSAAIAAGSIANFTVNASESVGNLITDVALMATSFTAVVGIDRLFNPINNAIFKTSEASLKASFAADRLFSQTAKNATGFAKAEQTALRFASKGLGGISKSLGEVQTFLGNSKVALAGFNKSFLASQKITVGLTKGFISAAKNTEFFEKGLAGLVSRSALGATAFAVLGNSMLRSESIIKQLSGVALIALGIALGGVVVIINQVLFAVGNLIQAIGTGLTNASLKQIEVFSKAEQTTFAFNQTITSYAKSSEEATKATADWTAFQVAQTEATGVQASTMRALIAETISATEATGLNVEQQKQLIAASIDLSERAHKPQIDTLTALINAMNGNSQAVITLGLHVNEAAISHSKLDQAQKDNFKSATDAGRAQTRFAVLMEQSAKAAGFASNNADLYSKAIKLQKNAQETLNAELGRGAVIINGEYRLGLATATNALTNFFKPILPGVGFLQALGGRVLEVTGFLVKNLLSVNLAISAYRTLNVLLAKGFASGVFGKQLPFINKSLGKMAKDLGAVNVRFDTLKNVGRASLQIIKKQTGNAVKAMFGLEASANLTAKTMGGQLVKGLKMVGKGIGAVTKKALLFVASPLGLTIAAVAAASFLLFKAFQKLEEETGIFGDLWNDLTESFAGTSAILEPLIDMFKVIGTILAKVIAVNVKITAAALAAMVSGVFEVILAFQKLSQFLPESMRISEEAMAKTQARISKLDATAKKLALGALADIGDLFIANAQASVQSTKKLEAWRKSLAASAAQVSQFAEASKKAFEFAEDFTPKMNLAKFEKDANKFESTLINLQGALEEKKLTLLDAPEQTEAVTKLLKDTEQKIANTEEAIKGIRIKKAQEIRTTRLTIISNELDMQRNKIFTVEQEIKQMRLDFATETRDHLVEMETQRLLEQRGLLSADAQAGISIKQQAALEANAIELEAFRSKLTAEKELALTAEQQKQLEIANIRAGLLQGTDAGAQATQDAEVLKEQQKLAQLNTMRSQELISEEQFQSDKLAIIQAGKQKQFELEMAMEMQRVTALGLSPEALAGKLEMQRQADEMELQNLRVKLENKQLTQEEFRIATEEQEASSQARTSRTKQSHLRAGIQQDKMRGESFKATLKEIELAQQQHGQIMGTLIGIQGSSQGKAVSTAFSNLSSLRNSESKKEFEIGKKAALAQATVSMFMGATQAFGALSGIPFVGPVLGAAAAAAAIAAGMMNIRQIKAQKFSGGSISGQGTPPVAPTPSQALGGQADQGMDAVPRSLAGKSFILSANERVVQPEANRDLTNFLDNVGTNESNLGTTVNITVQGNISSQADARIIADAVIEEIRAKSERGEPVINARGVTNG